MSTKNKILIAVLCVAFVCCITFSFLVPSTAKAVENVVTTTTFESNRYHDTIFTYKEYFSAGVPVVNNYRAFWYIDFQVTNDNVTAFFYSFDTNYNQTAGVSPEQGYTRRQLYLRPYSDTSTAESYFFFVNNGTEGERRVLDYVCQYEIMGNVGNSLPSYYTVSYMSLNDVIWNFTAKNYNLNTRDNAYCLVTHTWGNDNYRISLSFVAQYTRDFYDKVAVEPYSYTMYYSPSNTSSNGSYNAGYNAGVLAGINQANNTINTDSSSYKAGYDVGYYDGSDGTVSDWTFIVNSASTLLQMKIFGFFSIMDVASVVIAVSLFIIFLKKFAGG